MRYHVGTWSDGGLTIHADVRDLGDARSIAELWSKTSGVTKFVTDSAQEDEDGASPIVGSASRGVWTDEVYLPQSSLLPPAPGKVTK